MHSIYEISSPLDPILLSGTDGKWIAVMVYDPGQ